MKSVQTESRLHSELLERLIFETLISDISAHFVNVPADQVDSEIEAAQKGICECLGLEHSSLWQIVGDGSGNFVLTHLYRSPELPSPPPNANAFEYFPWALEQLSKNQIVCVPDTEQAAPEAVRDQQSWRFFHIRSALAIPLSVGGGPVFGALSFDATRGVRDWPEILQNRLQLVAQIFANALQRRSTEQKLRESETRLNLAAHSANAGLWKLNPQTGELWVTEKTRELLGLPPGSPVNYEIFIGRVLPEDRKRLQAAAIEALRSGMDSETEYRVPAPKGVRWMSVRGRRHPDKPNVLLGIVTDITETKRLQQERAELASRLLEVQEAERARIARELHDDLGQTLALFAVQLHNASSLVQSQAPGAEKTLDELGLRLSEIGKKVSALSYQLHSVELDLLGLCAAAKALCWELAQQHGLEIQFSCVPIPALSREIEISLFRVLQEALTNFTKHSKGSRADVVLRRDKDGVSLRISDNGIGMDLQHAPVKRRLGLVSMRERMRIVGGDLKIQSQPGKGMTVEAFVLLPKESARAQRRRNSPREVPLA